MSNLVIVAIPAEDDYVWKLSSEKKPHMTICFLGDAASNPNVLKIQQFLEHAVNILELGPFGLEVDYRGELGPDKADVLFFRRNWSLKRVEQFRGQLLKNTPIRNAYENAPQHDLYPDGWTPHLTMGYPGAPAREDKRDFPGTRWVEFDKVALWYGDFEGPEYRLQYNWDDLAEVGMSAEEAGRDFISHFGVKGMKWGVRKGRTPPAAREVEVQSIVTRAKSSKTKLKATGGENHPASVDAARAHAQRQIMKKSGVHALTNKELQELATRMNLEQQVSSLESKRPKTAGRQFVDAALKDPHKTIDTATRVGSASSDIAKLFK